MNNNIRPLPNGDFEVIQDPIFHVTEKEIVRAFKKWNKEYMDNPEKFQELDDSSTCSEQQADSLLRYLGLKQ